MCRCALLVSSNAPDHVVHVVHAYSQLVMRIHLRNKLLQSMNILSIICEKPERHVCSTCFPFMTEANQMRRNFRCSRALNTGSAVLLPSNACLARTDHERLREFHPLSGVEYRKAFVEGPGLLSRLRKILQLFNLQDNCTQNTFFCYKSNRIAV